MLTDYESIVIIEGEAAEKIISGEVTAEVVQKSAASGFTENSFVRNCAVISCISPSVNDEGKKVKISVMYRDAASLRFEYAAVLFSAPLSGRFEVRCQNETLGAEELICNGVKVFPAAGEGKLRLEFSEPEDGTADELRQAVSGINEENEIQAEKLRELEQQLTDADERNHALESQRNLVSEKIQKLTEENETMCRDMDELERLEQKNAVLSRNIEDIGFNSEKVQNLKNQLGVYSDILEYYRCEDGYITVKEKLEKIASEIQNAENIISELAQKRAGELQ